MDNVFIGEKEDVFDRTLIGSFGNFKTAESFELYYLMTTIRLERLNYLTTASQALSLNVITFNELIQRDIDFERVDNDIVEKYLRKGKDRVIFFPPLLATLMVTTKNGAPIEKYTHYNEKPIVNNICEKIWDQDKFKLILPLSEENTGYSINTDAGNKFYHAHAVRIAYNSNAVKLVVIDGQHRLSAIQRIVEKSGSDVLPDIKIPLCLFFTPHAIKDKLSNESVKMDMRELFVTVNHYAKDVSGHFITLLDDKSLASIATREFANKWKGTKDDYSDCYLHLLEWNQRESKRAAQLNRKYSITTVNIIVEALRNYIFNSGKTDLILNLSSVQTDLKKNGNCPEYSAIEDAEFCIEQVETLIKQMKIHIAPALEALLLRITPYAEKEKEFRKALSELNSKIESNINGAKPFRDDVLYQFRDSTAYDATTVRTIEKEFNSSFVDDEAYSFYFNNANVFQSGLIKAWVSLCKLLINEYELPVMPVEIAGALSNALNALCLKKEKRIFDSNRDYTQNLIFKGQKVKVTETARRQTANLFIGSLANDGVKKAFVGTFDKKKIGDQKKFGENISAAAIAALTSYFEDFHESTAKRIKKEWKIMDFDVSTASNLEKLEKLASKGKDEDVENYDKLIFEITKKYGNKAKTTLSNLFEIKKEVLM